MHKWQSAFQIATHETLSTFLATKQGTILHFSCHGNAGCLFLEDDWGGLAPLVKENLQNWVQVGGQELQFVFISDGHSQSIGQAFVDAGVPHVVCSREEVMVAVSLLFCTASHQEPHQPCLKRPFIETWYNKRQ